MTLSAMPMKPVQRSTEQRAAPRGWTFFIPGLSILCFTVLITLPWGFGPDAVYVPPLLIMALIVAWTIRYPTFVPSVLVFVVGVGVDVVTASPVGYWAFLFLVGYACALHVARWEFEWLTVATLVTLVPIVVLIGALGWVLMSVYFGQFGDWRPVYDSVKVTWLVCPLVVLATRWCANRMIRSEFSGGAGASAP